MVASVGGALESLVTEVIIVCACVQVCHARKDKSVLSNDTRTLIHCVLSQEFCTEIESKGRSLLRACCT